MVGRTVVDFALRPRHSARSTRSVRAQQGSIRLTCWCCALAVPRGHGLTFTHC